MCIRDSLNIDLSKSHSAWESTYSLVGLHQLVNKPTRVTSTTDTLIDHIYTNGQDLAHNVSVPNIGISDHYPVLCNWSMKLPQHAPKGHTTIQYRTFNRFNKNILHFDVSCAPFTVSAMFILTVLMIPMMLCWHGMTFSCLSLTSMPH